jgi:hypothetical protein
MMAGGTRGNGNSGNNERGQAPRRETRGGTKVGEHDDDPQPTTACTHCTEKPGQTVSPSRRREAKEASDSRERVQGGGEGGEGRGEG